MEFPTCTVTAVLMPGCWVKDFLSLLWLNTGDATSCPCPALLEVRFPDRTHLLFATEDLAGFSQCLIVSEEGCVGG